MLSFWSPDNFSGYSHDVLNTYFTERGRTMLWMFCNRFWRTFLFDQWAFAQKKLENMEFGLLRGISKEYIPCNTNTRRAPFCSMMFIQRTWTSPLPSQHGYDIMVASHPPRPSASRLFLIVSNRVVDIVHPFSVRVWVLADHASPVLVRLWISLWHYIHLIRV